MERDERDDLITAEDAVEEVEDLDVFRFWGPGKNCRDAASDIRKSHPTPTPSIIVIESTRRWASWCACAVGRVQCNMDRHRHPYDTYD